MADRSIFGLPLAGLNRAHDDLADVGADPDLEIHSLFRAQPFSEAAYIILHPERRIEGALRMIFMRNRRTEQREDTVPGGLHNVAAVMMDGVDHQPERRIDNRTSFFRVEVLHQLHRALDVSEQCCNGLALAVEILAA